MYKKIKFLMWGSICSILFILFLTGAATRLSSVLYNSSSRVLYPQDLNATFNNITVNGVLDGTLNAGNQNATNFANVTVNTNLTVGGQIVVAQGTESFPGLASIYGQNDGFWFQSNGTIRWVVNGAWIGTLSNSGIVINDNALFVFGTANDLRLNRDAANTFAQRNGTAAQTNRIYGTYTDSSNYERLTLQHDGAGTATIAAEEAGTGTDNQTLRLVSKGTGAVTIPNERLTIGTQPGIAATVDVLVGGGTTNRLVFVGGILVSNITNF